MPSSTIVLLTDGRKVSDESLAGLADCLGKDERDRLQRFVRPERRRQFVIGRVLARQALGQLLGVQPHALALGQAVGGKPSLRGAHPFADFSIAHSGPWVACAASLETALGLDIERIDPTRNILALAEQAFGDSDVAWLSARPAASRIRDFYDLWSASEARIKLGSEGECMHFLHDELAITLCCARPLDPAPRLVLHSVLELVQ